MHTKNVNAAERVITHLLHRDVLYICDRFCTNPTFVRSIVRSFVRSVVLAFEPSLHIMHAFPYITFQCSVHSWCAKYLQSFTHDSMYTSVGSRQTIQTESLLSMSTIVSIVSMSIIVSFVSIDSIIIVLHNQNNIIFTWN